MRLSMTLYISFLSKFILCNQHLFPRSVYWLSFHFNFLFLVCTMPTEVRETVKTWYYSGPHSTVNILECMTSVRSGYETIYRMNLSTVSFICDSSLTNDLYVCYLLNTRYLIYWQLYFFCFVVTTKTDDSGSASASSKRQTRGVFIDLWIILVHEQIK